MSQIRLVLADRDTMFLERFSAYLLKNKTPAFSLVLFSNEVKLDEWLRSGEKADIVAISSALYNDLAEKPDDENLILLRDCPESMLPAGFRSIYKYRPASFLMKEIISICAGKIPQDIDNEKDQSNINLVLYADGSDVFNPFGPTLAAIKAGSGRKTLYISLDEISDADDYFSGENPRGLSEMLYFVKSQKENLLLKAESCTTLDIGTGVYFMKGHHDTRDMVSLTEKELASLLKSVSRKSSYEEIVISRGFSNDILLPVLIRSANKIYITALNYFSSASRVKKINNILIEFENNNKMNLKDKAVFCVTNAVPNPGPLCLDSLDFGIKYLSSPIYGNNISFQSSGRYYSELKAISEI
jgi:hypothetical protein